MVFSGKELDCIVDVALKWGLRYVVVFGSRARGYAGPHSDYDVAVKVGRKLGFKERSLLYIEFEECLGRKLDLIVLDDWNPIIAWEALARGKLVYHCGTPCLNEYYNDLAKAIDEIADLEPLIKLFRREIDRALTRFSS